MSSDAEAYSRCPGAFDPHSVSAACPSPSHAKRRAPPAPLVDTVNVPALPSFSPFLPPSFAHIP